MWRYPAVEAVVDQLWDLHRRHQAGASPAEAAAATGLPAAVVQAVAGADHALLASYVGTAFWFLDVIALRKGERAPTRAFASPAAQLAAARQQRDALQAGGDVAVCVVSEGRLPIRLEGPPTLP